MRTLHYVQSIEPLQGGGLGQAALGMHLALREHGESTLVATRAAGFSDPSPGVRLFERVGPSPLYFSPSMFREAEGLVRGADWLHSHGCYTATQAALGRQAVRQGKPMVYHPHGFFDPWILRRSRLKKQLVRWLFEDRNFRNVRLWRALTRKEEGQIRALGFKQDVVVLPNGIRLEEIDQPVDTPLPHPPKRRPMRALFLGRIHPKKGLDVLIPAWAALHSRYPDWELLVVGPDEGGYLAAVREMVRAARLEDTVAFHPSVTGLEKVAVFRSADLFVLPSYSEGFPVAVVEAAAHRLPCVVTTECNFPELAEAEAAWECLPEQTAFRAALDSALAAGSAELAQRGRLGRQLVESRYTWPNIAAAMQDACKGLV
jgi:glycosyltransferase involved in cell wall biosynthesis